MHLGDWGLFLLLLFLHFSFMVGRVSLNWGKRAFKLGHSPIWPLSLFSPFIVILLASILSYFSGRPTMELSGILINKEFRNSDFSPFSFTTSFFCFGEEVGWRGFVLPYFQTKFNALTSAIIIS